LQQTFADAKRVADAAGGFVDVSDSDIYTKATCLKFYVREFSVSCLIVFPGIRKNGLVWSTMLHKVRVLIASNADVSNMNHP